MKIRRLFVISGLFALGGAGVSGCVNSTANAGVGATPQPMMAMNAESKSEKKMGHKSSHGGTLNAIEHCAVGHAEVKKDGDTLRLYFVGGDPDTTSAVTVPDKTVTLNIALPDGTKKPLTLTARPMELSGEKPGAASRFEGAAPFLTSLEKFNATGTVHYKGKSRPLTIEYPNGYDPD